MTTYLHGPMDYAKQRNPRFRVGDLDLPERRKRYATAGSRGEEDVATSVCPCATRAEGRTNIIVGECEMYKEEPDCQRMRGEEIRLV